MVRSHRGRRTRPRRRHGRRRRQRKTLSDNFAGRGRARGSSNPHHQGRNRTQNSRFITVMQMDNSIAIRAVADTKDVIEQARTRLATISHAVKADPEKNQATCSSIFFGLGTCQLKRTVNMLDHSWTNEIQPPGKSLTALALAEHLLETVTIPDDNEPVLQKCHHSPVAHGHRRLGLRS